MEVVVDWQADNRTSDFSRDEPSGCQSFSTRDSGLERMHGQNQHDRRRSPQLSEPILRRRAGWCAEHGADLAREFDLAIGLMEQRHAGINLTVGRHRVLRVSGLIEYLEALA